MSACVTDAAIKAAAVASAGGEGEWFELSDRAQEIALEDARVMLQAALPHLTYDRRPVGEYLADDPGGSVRWLDTTVFAVRSVCSFRFRPSRSNTRPAGLSTR